MAKVQHQAGGKVLAEEEEAEGAEGSEVIRTRSIWRITMSWDWIVSARWMR